MSPFRKFLPFALIISFLAVSSVGWTADPPKGPTAVKSLGKTPEAAQQPAKAPSELPPAKPDPQAAKKDQGKPLVSPEDLDLTPEKTQADATRILNEIIEGIGEGDFKKYTRNLSPDMRKFQTRQVFLDLQTKLQKNLGKLQSLTYLGFYDQLGKRLALFKARFEKDKNDALITIVLSRDKKELKANGLWFDAPALEKQ